MNKIFRFCAAGMLAVAFYGCGTSDSSKPVAPEEEKAQIDDQSESKEGFTDNSESTDNPETESKMTPGTICIFSMPTVMRTAPCYT